MLGPKNTLIKNNNSEQSTGTVLPCLPGPSLPGSKVWLLQEPVACKALPQGLCGWLFPEKGIRHAGWTSAVGDAGLAEGIRR